MTFAIRAVVTILALTFLTPMVLTAQGTTGLAGTWTYPVTAARPGGMPGTLVVQVSASEVTVRRDAGMPEVYPLDGAEIRLSDGRVGKAVFANDTLTLTLTRTRWQGNDGPYVTTAREVYRASSNSLTIERQAFGQRPGEPQGKGSAVQTSVYQRN